MKTKTKKVMKTTIMLITLAIAILIAYSIASIIFLDEGSSPLIQTYGAPALFLISVFLDLIPQYISPIVALVAAIASGINIYSATIATILGSTVGAIIGYAIGKKYLHTAVDILATKKSTRKLTQLTNNYGKIIIPLAAVSPIPYLPVAIGAIQFSKRNFIIYGLIPRALGIAAYAYLFSIF